MTRLITIASAATIAAGILGLGLAGATAAQASGLPAVGQADYYTMDQGTSLTIPAPGILVNDSDPENDPLYVGNAFSYQAADFIQVNMDGSFTFTPDPSFYGQGGFHYYPADYTSLGAETAVYITVTPTVPEPPTVPVANDDSYSTTQGTVLTVPAASGLLANDSVPAYLWATNAPGLNVVVDQDGGFVYTPAVGFVGVATFGYRTTDGITQSNDALVTITVTDPAVPPVDPGPVTPVANADTPASATTEGTPDDARSLTTLAYTGGGIPAGLVASSVALFGLGGFGLWLSRRRPVRR